jgi:hypothetical protein
MTGGDSCKNGTTLDPVLTPPNKKKLLLKEAVSMDFYEIFSPIAASITAV